MEVKGSYIGKVDELLINKMRGEDFLLGIKIDSEVSNILKDKLNIESIKLFTNIKPNKELGIISKINANHYNNLYEYTRYGPFELLILPGESGNEYIVINKEFERTHTNDKDIVFAINLLFLYKK